MRVVVTTLALLFLGVSAQAQPAASEPPRRAPVVLLAVGGLVGGAALGLTAATIAPGDDTAEALAFVAIYPVGVALGVTAAARVLNLDRSLSGPLRGALLGAGLGLAAGATVLYVNYIEVSTSDGILDGSILSTVAVGTFVALPVAFGVARVDVAPAALAAPTGERATGLGFTLRL